jgi:hypothetical protein
MSTRKNRIGQANQIFDHFPVWEYPPELQEKLRDDLKKVRVELATSIEKIMSQETGEITGHMQKLLAELRIEVEHLDNLVR